MTKVTGTSWISLDISPHAALQMRTISLCPGCCYMITVPWGCCTLSQSIVGRAMPKPWWPQWQRGSILRAILCTVSLKNAIRFPTNFLKAWVLQRTPLIGLSGMNLFVSVNTLVFTLDAHVIYTSWTSSWNQIWQFPFFLTEYRMFNGMISFFKFMFPCNL